MSKRVSQLEVFLAGFRTDSDVAASGYIVKFFTADQTYTTPKNAWDDVDKTSTLPSVTLDANGRYTSGLYFAGGEVYDLRLYESDGTTVVRSYPDVKIPESTFSIRTVTAASDTATVDDDVIICDTTSNAITINGVAVASALRPLTLHNIGSASNDVTFDPSGAELVDGSSTATLADGVSTVFNPDSNASQWRGQGVSSGSSGLLLDVQVFTSTGAWTKPAGANSVIVKIQGAGGGGGGCIGNATGSLLRFGGGGGGGGYSEKQISSGIGATETVTIGGGGAGGAAGANNGATGGTTSFGSLLSVTGGAGGRASGPSDLGNAGTPSIGTIIYGGVTLSVYGGSGDWGFGGTDADTGTTAFYRRPLGGSPGGDGAVAYSQGTTNNTRLGRGTAQDGIDANMAGQGGMGGTAFASTNNQAGGAGGDGYVIVESYS